jgi:shikimate dehydrogenase
VRRRAGVLGSPVAHSLSPLLHRTAYAALGLDWQYDAYDITAAELPGFLAGCDASWVGLSLTMPLKEAVLPLLDDVEPEAAALASVNTVLLSGGRRRGMNTDAPGLAGVLREAGRGVPERVTLLGGGATGRSALAAVRSLGGAPVDLVVRDVSGHGGRIRGLAERLGLHVRLHPWDAAGSLLDAPVVVSTVPAAAGAAFVGAVPGQPGLLCDVLYDPWPTPLAAAWERGGGAVRGGLDLLVAQAVLQLEAMTGSAVPPALLHRVGAAALAERAAP